MNNLQKISEAIYNALPRLKDDVVGQRYERHGEIYTCLCIDDSVKSEPFFYLYNTQITTWYLTEIQTRFDVLGKEIALNNVLEWFIISNKLDVFNEYIKLNAIIKYWNLSKPLLKDQPTELINYLVELV